jgi:RNA polymerase sigma-70 factor (ECF subfamily)
VFDELENLPAELVHVDFSDTFDSERISEAVRSLSVKQRMAILMWAYQDLTAAEIAKVMGMNKNGVDQLLFRAKLKLKSELEKGGAYGDN